MVVMLLAVLTLLVVEVVVVDVNGSGSGGSGNVMARVAIEMMAKAKKTQHLLSGEYILNHINWGS